MEKFQEHNLEAGYDSERKAAIQEYRVDLLQKLSELDIRPAPDSLDQHFTVDPILISELTKELGPENTIVEIGSGPGNITEAIAKSGAEVYAIEIDERFRPLLEERFGEQENVELIFGDGLDFQIPEDADEIVANPPFSIIEPLFKKLAESNIEHIRIIVGQNTLRSMQAKISSDDFSVLSLYSQASFRVTAVEELENISFYPQPNGMFYRVELARKGFSQEGGDYETVQSDRILEQFAIFLIENPNYALSNVLRFVLENNRAFNKRAKKYRDYDQMVTVESLGIQEELLNKSVGSLNNHEIRKVLQLLVGKINKRFKLEVAQESSGGEIEDEEKISAIEVKRTIEEMSQWSGGEYAYLGERLSRAIKDNDDEAYGTVIKEALEITKREAADPENVLSLNEISSWVAILEGHKK